MFFLVIDAKENKLKCRSLESSFILFQYLWMIQEYIFSIFLSPGSSSCGCIRTHDFMIVWIVLYNCAANE